ncbi:MAG: hypothetical protein J6A21_02935 [Lentisphaeria bacterium]|nr:hypothetical protein [Lentisphaeria bacterium]
MFKKVGDTLAIVFLAAFACAVIFFPLDVQQGAGIKITEGSVSFWGGSRVVWGRLSDGLANFGHFTAAFPYFMGFLKVGLLATFGEMLKNRRKNGSWSVPSLIPRFILWGITGMVFTLVFALFGIGTEALMKTNLWFSCSNETCNNILRAFSTSLLQNLIFSYPMMLGHEWCNEVINRKKFLGGAEFLANLDSHVWGSFIPKTILYFWIPAHTVTFLLPKDYRVLMSAVLALALGFLLTVKVKKNA